MLCEISYLGWLCQVSLKHPQDLSPFRAVSARAVGVKLDLGKCRWETESGKNAICARQGYQAMLEWSLIVLLGQINSCTC